MKKILRLPICYELKNAQNDKSYVIMVKYFLTDMQTLNNKNNYKNVLMF